MRYFRSLLSLSNFYLLLIDTGGSTTFASVCCRVCNAVLHDMAIDYSNAHQRNMRLREIIFPIGGNIFLALILGVKVHPYFPVRMEKQCDNF